MKTLMLKGFLCLMLTSLFIGQGLAQHNEQGKISGNVQFDGQTYRHDAKIGADSVPEKMLSNSYMNLTYTKGGFSAGVRFEAYLNTMLGYDNRYDGTGIAYRFGRYQNDFIDITAGNFYGQFGSGAVFRAYEERTLGYDNAMDGFMVKVKPIKGILITGIVGKQRLYWDKGEGIVRGLDAEFSLNDMIDAWSESRTRISIGGSYVSKYQKDEDPLLRLPENVGAGAGRINLARGGFAIEAEYAYKSQDPSADNNAIYKSGSTLLVNTNYAVKGFGIMLQYKWIDNMSFRSDRNARLNDVAINYLPAITKNHTYAFTAMYPYATQLNGEAGIQGEVFYKFKRGSLLGGKYGTLISVNYSRVHDIKREALADHPIGERGTDGYKTSFLSMSDSLMNQDFSVEITKKFSRRVKGIFTWQKADYNIAAIQGHGREYGGMVNANTFVADVMWKIKPKHALRFEAQSLFTKKATIDTPDNTQIEVMQDYGNWAMLMLEYTFSPHWFVMVSDQFNYVSFDDDVAKNTMYYVHGGKDLHRNHYYTVAGGYTKGASRLQLSYGKQREGILCVGGVCRAVPAAYGFNISLTTTF